MRANNWITELTEQEARLLDLKFVHRSLLEAQQQSPGRATWLDPAIDICEQEIDNLKNKRRLNIKEKLRSKKSRADWYRLVLVCALAIACLSPLWIDYGF